MNRKEFRTWRQGPQIEPDRTRVLLKPFVPGDDARIRGLLKRVSAVSDADAKKLLAGIHDGFAGRHRSFEGAFERRFKEVERLLPANVKLTSAQQLLIGSYLTCEYSLEAAALFNPSIVAHPDQEGIPSGSLRYIMSLRATGEGHISSIEFRSGLIDANGGVTVDPVDRMVTLGQSDADPSYDHDVFVRLLETEGTLDPATREILKPLGGKFSRSRLRSEIVRYRKSHKRLSPSKTAAVERVEKLAELNYSISFPSNLPLAERVIFPGSSFESNGIEDARFVRFVDDSGGVTYYATYTAYDGRTIRPLMLETQDFLRFSVHSLAGAAARNKGMALFPRKVRGNYMMISRQDAESLYLVMSDLVFSWDKPRALLKPTFGWELMQIGNCGSPIETDEGWLLLTHGVGPMRKYCIGAVLLDKDDPSRVVRRLREPLLAPDETEREGYVPNVVYTCGALVHHDRLVIPYAMSDYATRVASVSLEELFAKMVP